MKHIYTSIDIGSDTIKIVVCELFGNKLNLLAASSVKSRGIKKGLITDVEQALLSVREAVGEVEDMLGITIKSAIASVPAYFAGFQIIKGSTSIMSDDGVITGADVVKVFQSAMDEAEEQNKEMVTVLPIDFKVDDKTGIRDPKGMVGSSLETRAVMVSTPQKNIYSVLSLLEHAGLEIVDISLNSIGDVYAFKNKEIDEKVGAIINIGSDVTSVSLYNKGIIVKNSILQLGGKSVDNDIAYMYKLDPQEGKKIKEKFALAHKMYASVNDFYEIVMPDGTAGKINQFEVSEVVMFRLEEILNLAKKEISLLTNKKIEYIIITGGMSNMAHFEYIADEVFNKGVSIGNVKLLGIRNNKYSSAVGNIVYFINKLKLKGKDYSMVAEQDEDTLSHPRKDSLHLNNDSMLGKVFGYFFGE